MRAKTIPQGLIPACAGKTSNRAIIPLWELAHPRMRGENDLIGTLEVAELGSSPHARGKLAKAIAIISPRRLIPACAGKTSSPMRQKLKLEAHPRMRGENVTVIFATVGD